MRCGSADGRAPGARRGPIPGDTGGGRRRAAAWRERGPNTREGGRLANRRWSEEGVDPGPVVAPPEKGEAAEVAVDVLSEAGVRGVAVLVPVDRPRDRRRGVSLEPPR